MRPAERRAADIVSTTDDVATIDDVITTEDVTTTEDVATTDDVVTVEEADPGGSGDLSAGAPPGIEDADAGRDTVRTPTGRE